MKNKKYFIWLSAIFAVTAVLVGAATTTVLILRPGGAEAASPAKQTNEALQNIRTNGQTIVCGPFHEPLIIAGVPVSYSKEEGYLKMQDGYMLEVEPFSFYANKYMGLQIDPDTREVTRSILVGDEDYYPCPQQARQAAPQPAPTP